jgi:hypothetical protein
MFEGIGLLSILQKMKSIPNCGMGDEYLQF